MEKKVSVILPTYNPEFDYVKIAINSILNQSYKNFILFIIDDSDQPDCLQQLEDLCKIDMRIKLVRTGKKKGIANALNIGLAMSEGEYVFRMDSDDISLHDRFKKQIEFLDANKNIDILGANAKKFGNINRQTNVPLTDQAIKTSLLFACPMIHPTVVFRKKTLDRYSLQYPDYQQAEDYNFWCDCFIQYSNNLTFANINNVMLKYRVHQNQQTTSHNNIIHGYLGPVYNKMLNKFHISLSQRNLDIYKKAMMGALILTTEDFLLLDSIFKRIIENNKESKLIEPEILKTLLLKKYNSICFHQFYLKGNDNLIAALGDIEMRNATFNILFHQPFRMLHNTTTYLRNLIK